MNLPEARVQLWIQTYSRMMCTLSMSPLLTTKSIKAEAKRVADLAVEGLEENLATLLKASDEAE